MRVHRLFFDLDGEEPPTGFEFALPEDTFDHPPIELGGIPIHVVSPLALYQLRLGIAARGSFGDLSERQRAASRALRDTFFAHSSDEDLTPRIARLRERQ